MCANKMEPGELALQGVEVVDAQASRAAVERQLEAEASKRRLLEIEKIRVQIRQLSDKLVSWKVPKDMGKVEKARGDKRRWERERERLQGKMRLLIAKAKQAEKRALTPTPTPQPNPPSPTPPNLPPPPPPTHEYCVNVDLYKIRSRVTEKRKRSGGRPKGVTVRAGEASRDDGDDSLYYGRIDALKQNLMEISLENDSCELSADQHVVDMLQSVYGKEEERFDGLRLPSVVFDRLFDYQVEALQWLYRLHKENTGGIMGDEMGLGKTVQVVAFLGLLQFNDLLEGPILVLCPATTLDQWKEAFLAWWPYLRLVVLHHTATPFAGLRSLLRRVNYQNVVVFSSYAGMRSYADGLLGVPWGYVVLDEGHMIRNRESDIARVCKQVGTFHRIVLSGTPIQNSLLELWSLFDFIFPGKLGTLDVFQKSFHIPIELGGRASASVLQIRTACACARALQGLIQPYLLRRTKAMLPGLALPGKEEQVLFLELSDMQRARYVHTLNSEAAKRVTAHRGHLLALINQLRKICNHAGLVETGSDGYPVHHSSKLVLLQGLLPKWEGQGDKVLIFSQSLAMLELISALLQQLGLRFVYMDGTVSLSARRERLAHFNHSQDVFAFLLSTRVGGVGLNLTGANKVLLVDPDWNPSTDQQAQERSYRIGQTRAVQVYRLICRGTIEEKIYQRQIFKQYLSNKVLHNPMQKRYFQHSDLHDLLSFESQPTHTPPTGLLNELYAATGLEVSVQRMDSMGIDEAERALLDADAKLAAKQALESVASPAPKGKALLSHLKRLKGDLPAVHHQEFTRALIQHFISHSRLLSPSQINHFFQSYPQPPPFAFVSSLLPHIASFHRPNWLLHPSYL